MSGPDQFPPSGPTLEDFRREPHAAPDPADDTPPRRSGFLSGCLSAMMIFFGVLLLLPGICFAYIAPGRATGAVALATVVGLAMIVGGIVWLTQAVRERP